MVFQKGRVFVTEAGTVILACTVGLWLLSDYPGLSDAHAQPLDARLAEPLYEFFVESLEALGLPCSRGVFGARMAVELLNDGPVTFVLES